MIKNIKQVILDSYQIGKKDILDFFRDRVMLISFVIMPIFMMVMMGYIFPSQNALKNLPLGVLNEDEGQMGSQVVEVLRQMKMSEEKTFDLMALKSVAEAKDRIEAQTINGALVIPRDFSEAVRGGRQTSITLITDQSNPQVSSMLTGALGQIVDAMATQAGEETVRDLLPSTSPGIDPKAIVKPFILKIEGIVPGEPNYFEFMAPGIMAMVVMMAVMMGLGGAIAREKELGTLDGILAAPIARISIILGKTFSQTVRGLLQGALVLILAMLFFGVTVHGSLVLVALMLILGIFSFIGLGILISAAVSAQETAMTIMMTLTFPMLFLSGAFFPIQQMPGFMQAVSKVLPMTYAVQALRKVIVLGAGVSAVSTDIIVLAAFGAVMLIIAIPVFNRMVTR